MYEQLYEQNRGLLRSLAMRWREACERDRAVSVEDLEQAGFFGLVKASQSYDAAAGKAWSSWAAWYVFKEFETALCLRAGRQTQAHTAAFALDAPLMIEDAGGATYGDTLPDDSLPEANEATEQAEVRREVRAAVERIEDGAQRQAVRLYDLEGKSIDATAEALDVPVAQARMLRRKAHKSLREDPRLFALMDEAYLDEHTLFYVHKGVIAFERDRTSVTEGAALWRIERREKLRGRHKAT